MAAGIGILRGRLAPDAPPALQSFLALWRLLIALLLVALPLALAAGAMLVADANVETRSGARNRFQGHMLILAALLLGAPLCAVAARAGSAIGERDESSPRRARVALLGVALLSVLLAVFPALVLVGPAPLWMPLLAPGLVAVHGVRVLARPDVKTFYKPSSSRVIDDPGVTYTCPGCGMLFRLPVRPAPGTRCPECRGLAGAPS